MRRFDASWWMRSKGGQILGLDNSVWRSMKQIGYWKGEKVGADRLKMRGR